MRKQKSALGKRITAVVLTTFLALSDIPSGGFGTLVVKADEVVTNGEIPKQQYASQEQLLNDCDLQISNAEYNTGNEYDRLPVLLQFGKNGARPGKWFVAGRDQNNGDKTIALLSDLPFGDPRHFDEDSNCYSASDVRQFLKTAYAETEYFSAEEKTKMKETSYQTVEGKSTSSTTVPGSDVLYLPDFDDNTTKGYFGDSNILLGAKSDIKVNVNINHIQMLPMHDYSNDYSYRFFWLRTAILDDSGLSVRCVDLDANNIGNTVNKSLADFEIYGNQVIPAFDLDISDVLFASAAQAGSDDNKIIDVNTSTGERTALVLRFDGASMIAGSAAYGSEQVDVTKGSGTAETIYIQGFTPNYDYNNGVINGQHMSDGWCYQAAITENQTITAETIKTECSLSYTPNLMNCKIWIEKKGADGFWYAKEAVADYYDVHLTAGEHMSTQGAETQSNIKMDTNMTPVTYTADEGYYFPAEYSGLTKDGITVARQDNQSVIVSGKTSGSAAINITVPSAIKKSTPSAPTGLSDTGYTIWGTTDQMEYAKMEIDEDIDTIQWTTCQNIATEVSEAGTWYVRFKATDTQNASVAATVVVAERYRVAIQAASHMRKTSDSGEADQSNLAGPMTPVIYQADADYYFPDTYTIDTVNGITVSRNDITSIQISGTPSGSADITLTEPTEKGTQNAPAGLQAGKGKILGTTTAMEYANDSESQTWTKCSDEKTGLEVGTWYVRYASTDTLKASTPVAVTIEEPDDGKYSVTIIGQKETKLDGYVTNANLLEQKDLSGDMEPVVIEIKNKQSYFPLDYKVDTKNGISVTRNGYFSITISGKPTDDTTIILPAFEIKNVQEAPTGVDNGEGAISGTTSAMEYRAKISTSVYADCSEGATTVSKGTYLVRYKETDTKGVGEVIEVTVTAPGEEFPKETWFATKEQLTAFNLAEADSAEGTLSFGNQLKWLIAGGEGDTLTLWATKSLGDSKWSEIDTFLASLLSEASLFSEAQQKLLNTVSVSYYSVANGKLLQKDPQKLYIPDAASPISSGDVTIYVGDQNQYAIDVTHWPYIDSWLRSKNAYGISTLPYLIASGSNAQVEYVGSSDVADDVKSVIPAANLNIENVEFASAVSAAATDGFGTIKPLTAMSLRFQDTSETAHILYQVSEQMITVTNGEGYALVVQSNQAKNNWYYKQTIHSNEETILCSQINSAIGEMKVSDLSECKIWLEKVGEDGLCYAKQAMRSCQVTLTNPAASHMTRRTTSGAEVQTVTDAELQTVLYQAEEGYYFPEDYKEQSLHGVTVTRKSKSIIEVSGTPSGNVTLDLTGPTAMQTKEKSVTLGDMGIHNPKQLNTDEIWQGDSVYFGKQLWRVLEDSGLLFSEALVKTAAYDEEDRAVTWNTSSLYTDLAENYLPAQFAKGEQAVLEEYVGQQETTPTAIAGEKCGTVFLLSYEEITNKAYGFYGAKSRSSSTGTKLGNGYWLRSLCKYGYKEGPSYVINTGEMYTSEYSLGKAYSGMGVRPAIDIDMSQIAFTTLPDTKKDTFALTTEKTSDTLQLTLKGGTGFTAQRMDTQEIVEAGDSLCVSVTSLGNSKSGVSYNQLSAMLVDENNTVYAYGQIADQARKRQVDIAIPSALEDGTYRLLVFAEDVTAEEDMNGTDYASNMVEIPVTVGINPEKIVGTVETVTADILSGTYTSNQLVTLSTTTEDAAIYYTTDGSDPSSANGTLYEQPIEIQGVAGTGKLTCLKAVAIKNRMEPSQISTYNYMINIPEKIVETVTADILSGTYSSNQLVTLSTTTEDAEIYYTTDGSDPSSANGSLYEQPIEIQGVAGTGKLTCLKAVAIKNRMEPSQISTYNYLINIPEKIVETVETVTADILSGTYSSNQLVTLSTKTEDAAIYYTTDGSIPSSSNGSLYEQPIEIQGVAGTGKLTCLKAIAIKDQMVSSEINTYNYMINIPENMYSVIVTNGSGDGSYKENTMVTIKAEEAPKGFSFANWEVVSGEVDLIDDSMEKTVFNMPAGNVTVRAIYKAQIIDIQNVTVTGITDQNYTGKAIIQPGLTVKSAEKTLKEGIDYTVAYENNTNIGTSTLTITGIGTYTGTMTKTFEITVAKGDTYTVSSLKYQITDDSTDGTETVTLTGTTKSKSKLTSLSIGSTVKIGGKSFQITEVSDKAFVGYTKLKQVTIGANVTSIGKEAYSGCKALKTITIKSKKLKKIGKNAIKGIYKKATIKVPESKAKSYKKLFKSSTGFLKSMKVKK